MVKVQPSSLRLLLKVVHDTQECCDIAYSIAHSPLVKTAIFASDPNWGRIWLRLVMLVLKI